MLYLLLGQDEFSKRQYIEKARIALAGSEIQFFDADDETVAWSVFLSQDLFAKPKMFILNGCMKALEKQGNELPLPALLKSSNHIFILENKLDKRSALAKRLLSESQVKTVQFDLPHQSEFDKWILSRVEELHGNISQQAARLLAQKLGRDDFEEIRNQGRVVEVKEVFSLWQTDAEIRKLIALAAGREISSDDVEALVSAEIEVDGIEIANALADNQRRQTLELVDRFLKNMAGTDQKTGVIQLCALLAEQFRNLAALRDFLSRRMSEAKILEITGWKPGRLFVLKRVASHFSADKIWQTLNKLEALDEVLKTSSTPPRVVLDLILAQLFTISG